MTNYTNWLKLCAFKVDELSSDIDNKISYWKYIDKKEISKPSMNWLLLNMDDSIFNQEIMQNQIEKLQKEFKERSLSSNQKEKEIIEKNNCQR